MGNDRLMAPSIALESTISLHDVASGDQDAITRIPFVGTVDNSFLSVKTPPSPATTSLDGETLRSRSNSFLSNAETARSRANSDVNVSQKEQEPQLANHVASSTTVHVDPFKSDQQHFSPSVLPRPSGRETASFGGRNPFGFVPGQLNLLSSPKSLAVYGAFGGLPGLARGLRTDLAAGLSIDESYVSNKVPFDDVVPSKKPIPLTATQPISNPAATFVEPGSTKPFHDRVHVFGNNRLPAKKPTTIWKLLWNAYNDKILILLTIAAVISLTLGLYTAFGQPRPPGTGIPLDWVEGVAICVAILVVVVVTAINDLQKEKQFVSLNKKRDDRDVKAIRSGKSVLISVFDVLVGDVLHLEPGDSVPADGILISGHGVKCDESSATGESNQMKKTAGQEAWEDLERGTATEKTDPFLISGSIVLEGVGTYLVTSVGVNSSYGKTMMSLQTEAEDTPLQVKLAGLADRIGYIGSSAAGLLFLILLCRFLASLPSNTESAAAKGSDFVNILIVAITIIVVAVPEGLPLAVTLALAFATFRMLKERNLVRHLRACETMGNATTICSDKTGTLTENKMTVVGGTLGTETRFMQDLSNGSLQFSTTFDKLSPTVKTLLVQSVAINSTAFDGEERGTASFVGSKTETALLELAKVHLGMGSVAEERSAVEMAQFIPFDSSRKCMGVIIRIPSGGYRLHVKGAAEILLAKATREIRGVTVDRLQEQELSDAAKSRALSTINSYAERSLRTIAMVYRDFEQWPPVGARLLADSKDEAEFDDIFTDMTLLSIVGIQDPLRPGVKEAVRSCQNAGIMVRMVTGDNAITAQTIATECGIKTDEGVIMEGKEFRVLSDSAQKEILPRLQVLARSSPEDKRVLVARLKQLGETVAVTGDGTNDGPALKMADVGFSMGITGTEVAKEASAIILMDDNFSCIITAIKWGRAVNDAVAKFLQFQITVNITAVLLAFITAVYSTDMSSVLSAVQLLWVNLIMDTFAALALATDAPTDAILDRKPTPKSAPLITTNMWKMIIGQAIYQLAVTLVLYFAGDSILHYDFDAHPEERDQLNTMIFNTFVWMQIFNEFNNRRLDNKLNIFEGVHRNWFFIGINSLMIGGQIMIIFVGGAAFQVTRISGSQWAICVFCAVFCLPWAVLLRSIPDRYAATIFAIVGKIFMTGSLPLMRLMRMILEPVVRAWGLFWAPLKRFASRKISKLMRWRREGANVDPSRHDDEEVASTKADPAPELQPADVPPITLTSMD